MTAFRGAKSTEPARLLNFIVRRPRRKHATRTTRRWHMPQLKHSKVYRGGAKAPSLSLETSKCSASVGLRTESLELRFDIASKGGGTTRILLQIGKGDFQTLLQEIAT